MKYGVISRAGCAVGRMIGGPKPDRHVAMVRHVLDQSGLFDERFYRKRYGDRLLGGMDPLDHYIARGAGAGLAPNPWFDTQFYLTNNPDVAESGWNPLFHFVQHGWMELRSPSAEGYDLVWHSVMDDRGGPDPENPMKRHCAQYRAAPGKVIVRTPGPLTEQEAPLFAAACHTALAERQIGESALGAIAAYAVRNKLWATAADVFHALILQRPDVLAYRLSLVDMAERQGRVWQAAEVLAEAVEQAPGSADLLFRLGDAQERMGRYAEAASAFAKALAINGDSAHWHYRHGFALERSGQQPPAKAAYAIARQLDQKHGAARLGVGIFHQNRGLWKDAALAYEATAALSPGDAELWFKLGFAHDRCYEWAKAQHAYSVALSHEFGRPYWHYRLGFVLERQEKWREAAGAYRTGADMDTRHRGYWYYRCGYVLEKDGAYAEACSAYLLTSGAFSDAFKTSGTAAYAQWFPSAKMDRASSTGVAPLGGSMADIVGDYLKTLSPEPGQARHRQGSHVHTLARMMEARGDLEAAVQAYRSALDLSVDHQPTWHHDLGGVLTRLGRYDEACEAFRNSRILKRPYGVDLAKYEANKHTKASMEYCEYLETLPIRKNAILYESFHGASVGCNPYAIFRQIIDRPEFAGWTHVWVIDESSKIPSAYADRENVLFIPRNSDAYRRHLATAEYLINNATFPYWFTRREGQRYLNTWHGTPLKGLGRDVKNEPLSYGNITRNFLHATHLLSPNLHTSDVMMKRFDVAGIYAGKFAETGYPRVDQVINNDEKRKRQVLEDLGLEAGKPIVLYAPTWRGALGKMQTDINRIIADVSAMAGDDYQLVFRGHYFEESALAELDVPVRIASHRIDTGDLLSVVDVLVTDYSSIFFDFFPTGKPVIYYSYDLEEYSEDRGLYFDIADLPGALCSEIKEVREAIAGGLGRSMENDPAYQRALAQFCPFEDGNSTQRAVEFLFSNSDEAVVDRYEDKRRSIVMYNGMFPVNGITSSYLNLLRSLESEDVQISTLFDPVKIKTDPVRVQNFESMPEGVKRIAHIGGMVMTPEEIWITHRFNTQRTLLETPEMQSVYSRVYQREYRRVFGDMKHDAFVNFEGLNALTSAMATGAPADVRKVTYLHSDMIEERDLRMPYLSKLFILYNRYDRLVSVSNVMREINSRKISNEFDVERRKFAFCNNAIDSKGIMAKAEESIDPDLGSWFGHGVTFVCLGRLSPEKGLAKLLRAFSTTLEQHPDAKLVIIGDGPLKQDLSRLIDELDVTKSVKLAGLRMNPFPALKAADCLVMASDYEGQPLVLVEAMVLEKPIIATDIAGNRDVLGDEYGELVENSETGLREGMLAFLERGGRPYSFSASEYQANAVKNFKNVVLSGETKNSRKSRGESGGEKARGGAVVEAGG